MGEYCFFKYRCINKNLLDSLVKGYLYFAHPEKLDDPFDCKVNIRKSINQAISMAEGKSRDNLEKLSTMEELFNQIQTDVKSVGICSFSLDLLKPILWSHYADECRGVCLYFVFPESFINFDKNKIIGVASVEYGENPLTDWFLKISGDLPKMEFSELLNGIMQELFTIKSKDWEDQLEARIIHKDAGPLKIEKSFLKQICFGLNTPESDKELIRMIVSDCGYKVSYCQIERKETDFGITVRDIQG